MALDPQKLPDDIATLKAMLVASESRAAAAELPEKTAVRQAARIVDYSWRDMTLAFANVAMAERVREMNPEYATGAEPDDSDPNREITATDESPPPAEDITV